MTSSHHPSPRRYPPALSDMYAELDRAVHHLYRLVEAELPYDADDADFVDLHNLRVECDPMCNRLVRAIRRFELRHPEAA